MREGYQALHAKGHDDRNVEEMGFIVGRPRTGKPRWLFALSCELGDWSLRRVGGEDEEDPGIQDASQHLLNRTCSHE